ncbi:major histocompatibility complex class I-related gene protein-like isoform X2 [Sminthopsis crassicaudata]|uniref:major histocompatibility complex class I-related gene protein-like isoform X2 n=1 Tax=Sminthopsis crassicaudata TaxID=9301 RepID=UPI003D68F116
MACQRKWRWRSSGWLFILGLVAFRGTQTVHHRHVGQLTAVGTYHSLLELRGISFMDDIEVGSYNNADQQMIIKIPWISKALGADYINQMHHLLVTHEQNARWVIQFFSKNNTNHNRNHTAQLLADCEIDNGIMIKSRIHLIWEGEEYYRIDEEVGHWENLKPENKEFRYILDSPFWTNLRKRFMNEYCVNLLRKIVGYSSLRDNATGFYPQSILLQWKKNGELGVWGKETSSGILPNMDSTFYLRLTLELPPEDSGTGYTCVVEHTELKTPTVYPVPEKPTVEKPWGLTLSIVLAVILLMSCAGAFIAWKKRKLCITCM